MKKEPDWLSKIRRLHLKKKVNLGDDQHKVKSPFLSRETTSLFMRYDRRHWGAVKYPQIAFVTPQQHHRRIQTVPVRQYIHG